MQRLAYGECRTAARRRSASQGFKLPARLISFGLVSALWAAGATQAADYTITDPNDAETLERSLFLCLWKTDHGAPDGEPSPVVCTITPISTDDAVHETKQWWTYWARFTSPDDAMRAKIRFNNDFLAFEAKQRDKPDVAQQLLPQSKNLPADDWRVLLVQDLIARAIEWH